MSAAGIKSTHPALSFCGLLQKGCHDWQAVRTHWYQEAHLSCWPKSSELKEAARVPHVIYVHGLGMQAGHWALWGGSLGSDTTRPAEQQRMELWAGWGRSRWPPGLLRTGC